MPIVKPPLARTRIDGAPSTVVMNSSERPPLIDVIPVANVAAAVGSPPMLPPMVPGTSCATCVARRALSGVSAIWSARTVRPMTAVSTRVVAACTCTVSVRPPSASWMSTRMLRPALTRTPVREAGVKPDSVALTR